MIANNILQQDLDFHHVPDPGFNLGKSMVYGQCPRLPMCLGFVKQLYS